MEITIEHRLTVAEDRSLRNEGRIKKLEQEQADLRDLTTSVAVLAKQMESMTKSVDAMSAKVDSIEGKPAERWDKLVSTIIGAVAGAFIAWVVSGAPGL